MAAPLASPLRSSCAVLLAAAFGCDPASDTIDVGQTSTAATSSVTVGSTSTGFLSMAAAGSGGGPACVATSVPSTLEKRPVDIVMMVDTSGTMAPVSAKVEQTINGSLAQQLEQSGLDYRVIAIALYGSGAALCVGPPLGSTDCDHPPAQPVQGPRFFHYVKGLGSGGMPAPILTYYDQPDNSGAAPNGYKEWLRPDSQKVILVFSDTDSTSTSAAVGTQFDADLLALDPAMWGTPQARNYTFHAVIGLRANNPIDQPWLATDPLVNGACAGLDDVNPGQAVQQVSILTGGLRFPVCAVDHIGGMFEQIAAAVDERSVRACDIAFPAPPPGDTIDPATISVTFAPSGNDPVVKAHQVSSPGACEEDAFYVVDETIYLCPDTCDAIQNDPDGDLDVSFGCDVGYVP